MAKKDKDNEITIVDTNAESEITAGNLKVYTVTVNDSRKFRVVNEYSREVLNRKWIFIAIKYLDTVKKIGNSIQIFDKWGQPMHGGKKPIYKFGIGKQYESNTKVVEVFASDEDFANGTIYYYEPFLKTPTFNSGFYIATVYEPMLFSAYFATYKDEFKYPNEDNKSNIHTYKGVIRLFISTHLIPDYTVAYHNFALFEVDIFDAKGDKKMTEEPLRYFQKTHSGKFSVNTLTELEFEIDEKWRDASNHEATKNLPKTFYAKIKTTIYSNKDANPSSDVIKKIDSRKILSDTSGGENTYFARRDKFAGVAPNLEQVAIKVNKEDLVKGWFGDIIKDETKKNASNYTKTELKVYNTLNGTVLTNQKVSFDVRYDLMDVILEKYEAEKNNMMVVVGDTKYTQKGIEPCKFSSIEVSQKGRKPVVIFDEEQKVGKALVDKTQFGIGIIAGIKKEIVTITAKGLATEFNSDAECLGITKKIIIAKGAVKAIDTKHESIQEFKHSSIEKIFTMEQAYILFPYKLGNPNAPATNTKGNETLRVDGQHLEYELGVNSIDLKLAYIFNKNYDDRVLNFLAHKTKSLKGYKNFKNAWVINYLIKFIKGEKLYQSYFVPVTTCRYPNQTVHLAVYPDMKWILNFNYNIKTPLYYKASTPLESYYANFNEGKYATTSNSNKRKDILNKEIENELQTFVGRKTDFGLYVECEIDGSNKIKFGKDFAEKFRNMLAPLMWIVDTLDSDIGVSKAKAEQKRLKKIAPKGLLARFNKLPMSFELTAPNIGVGVGIGYGETKDYKVDYELEGRVLMDPIIGADIKLDILALGSKFKPWGAIIDALDIASWLANTLSSGKLEINYELSITFTAKILLVAKGSTDGNNSPAELAYNFGTKKFKGNIALQGVIEGKVLASLEIQAYVKKKKKKRFEAVYNVKKDKEKSFKVGAGAEASSFVSLTLGAGFGENDNFDADFYFSGVTIKVWVKFGYKGKNKKLKLIPHLDKKINVLKNKGEYK